MAQILVVDDEVGIRELLSEILREEGHDVALAESATAARAARQAARPDLVLLDIWMPDTDGVTLLREWSANGQLTMPVIMMSGHATIDSAVEATRIGAMDFLEKPIGMQRLISAVKRGLERVPAQGSPGLSLAFARSGPLRDLRRRLEQLTARSRTLLLRAPADGVVELVGTSARVPGRPWLDLSHDSQPLSMEQLENALGGVLFVEELSRLNRLQQKNLLFALGRLDRFDLRLICATTQDAAELAAQGWDEEAVRRLFEVSLTTPSLADLRDDIPEMAAHLLEKMAEAGEVPAHHLSTAARNFLRQRQWPGGYGELKAAVKSLALGALEEEIGGEEAGQILGAGPAPAAGPVTGIPPAILGLPLREARDAFERIYFEHHLSLESANMTRLAEICGLERTHLYRKLKDLGLR